MARMIRLIALLAVLLLPFGMVPAAAADSHQHMASMPMQHCPEQVPSQGVKGGFAECTMACSSALPAFDAGPEETVQTDRGCNLVTVAHVLHGLHPDTATPPPKAA